jgi:CheY-like chemotaxis protein
VKRILIVEDDAFLRRACATALERRGYAVQVAGDGEEGLRLVEAHPPDLVLLDLLMPKMGGLEMLRRLRALHAAKEVPVLVVSSSSRQQDIEELTALGISGYLLKISLSLQDLGNRVASLVGEPSG